MYVFTLMYAYTFVYLCTNTYICVCVYLWYVEELWFLALSMNGRLIFRSDISFTPQPGGLSSSTCEDQILIFQLSCGP